MTEQRDDVPLSIAMLAWTPAEYGSAAIVVPHPDDEQCARGYHRAAGACFGDPFARGGDRDWPRMNDAERMSLLLAFAWQAVARDGVPPADMHKALSVVPEFRALMTPDMFPDPADEADA